MTHVITVVNPATSAETGAGAGASCEGDDVRLCLFRHAQGRTGLVQMLSLGSVKEVGMCTGAVFQMETNRIVVALSGPSGPSSNTGNGTGNSTGSGTGNGTGNSTGSGMVKYLTFSPHTMLLDPNSEGSVILPSQSKPAHLVTGTSFPSVPF